MKAVDTPLLLELLRGRPSARSALKALQGEELATTEVNFFELEAIVAAGPRPGRDQRRAALERLRRKLTILSVDGRGSAAAASLSAGRLEAARSSEWLMLGTALANGCTEWLTTSGAHLPKDLGKLRLRVVSK
ncbi:MAG: PIN domain-containing protein [Thermoplasmata archaeon]|nr:PIN domain-containing protein [Thermoplasmata archaeon]